MKPVPITITFDDDKLDALEMAYESKSRSVEHELGEYIQKLYEKSVPKDVRAYVERKLATAQEKKARSEKL